jgi:dTDP-4-dehydrorhamnose reductase
VRAFSNWDVTALDRAALDITAPDQIEATMAALKPDVVFNPAAYNYVDRAESEPAAAFLVNAVAPQMLADACDRHGALLVHYSTDYVFDGEKRSPYLEDDPVLPLSAYGVSKAAGEMAVRARTDRHLIIRTTGLYGHAGRSTPRGNFVETMLRLATAGKPITVVADQVLTPTATSDLAEVTRGLLRADARGTFHITNSGACSWYEFACEIFHLAGLGPDVEPVRQCERPMPARRPSYSVLGHDALLRMGMPDLRPWQDALDVYIRTRA